MPTIIYYIIINIIMVDSSNSEGRYISFERSPAKYGTEDDFMFKIPRNYIRNNLINPDKKYKVFAVDDLRANIFILPKKMTTRIDKLINEKGKSLKVEDYFGVVKMAISQFLENKGY